MVYEIIKRLERAYREELERDVDKEELEKANRFFRERGLTAGEVFFCPEKWFYDDVLELLKPDDVVFDVGAGDLRFALLASQKVKKVYAVEVNPTILGKALTVIGFDLPSNVIPICADAWKIELPRDVTVITCLMIHRTRPFPKQWLSKRIIYTRREGVYVEDVEKRG